MDRLPTILIPPGMLAASGDPISLKRVTAQTLQPAGTRYNAPRGHSETQFEHNLWHYFPGKIHAGLMVKRPDYEQPYVPDFAYIDPHLGFHIDIEVDEPYTHDTRQPLHYLHCPKDEQRNQFFVEQGWVVIRFSERQVVRSSASCCRAIASTIARITADNTIMQPFRQIPTLKPERRWTQVDAQRMAESAVREGYFAQVSPAPVAAHAEHRKQRSQAKGTAAFVTANFTFYCPECGDGPIRWQGHYICCPNCGYDAFVL